jgi:hypothetical protein
LYWAIISLAVAMDDPFTCPLRPEPEDFSTKKE